MGNKIVGQKIKKAIKESLLTQEKAAEKIGTSQSAIGNWISGSREPSLESLKKISKITGFPLSYFIDDSKSIENLGINISGQNSINGNITQLHEKKEKHYKKLEDDLQSLEKKQQLTLAKQEMMFAKLDLILEKLKNK